MLFISEQSVDIALAVNVDAVGGGNLGKSGHSHNVAGVDYHKACACGELDITDGYLKAEYCSDNYVHQTNAAYKVWADILRSLAAHNIKWGY